MNRKILFLFLLLPSAIFAQVNVGIHCSFSNSAGGDTVTLTPLKYYIDEYEKAYRSTVTNNECEWKISISSPSVARLIYHNQVIPLYVEPSDELQIRFDNDSFKLCNSLKLISDFKGVSFSGRGAVQNEFLKNFYQLFHKDFDKDELKTTILNSDVDAFEMHLFDARKKQLNFFNSYKDKDSFSESFKKYVEGTIRYSYYASLLSYPLVQANQSTQILTVKAFPSVMLESVDSKLVNDEALICETYRDFLYNYDVYFTSEANGFNKFRDNSLSMESKVTTAGKNFTGQSEVWFIAWYLNRDLDKVSQYTAKHIYDVLSLKENTGTYTKLLKSKVNARLAMKEVAGAQPAGAENSTATSSASQNGFPVLKDIDGKSFTFDDLKGKVVYVDYWASWCGPCRNEMPYSKQLHEMFTPQQLKQIVFLYISIDATEDAWKSAVKQIGMEGKLAISPGNWNSPIANFFQINSIPRYMLIDKKGNIVDLNAKRPSSGQDIYNDILKLLE